MKKFLNLFVIMGLSMALISCGKDDTKVRVGSMKGPTSMGIVSMIDDAKEDEKSSYEFTMVTAADELLAKMIAGDLDIAMIPANMASVLYNKTEGQVRVIDINTLGVLYVVERGDEIQSVQDLEGKTLYLTGKGTTPDYVLQYLLGQNGMSTDDVTLEYKSEATEVVAALSEDSSAVGLLPQPFATVALNQCGDMRIALNLTEEWDQIQMGGSRLVTGVTVVTKEFSEKHEKLVKKFLEDHAAAAEYTNTHVEEAAELIAEQEIVAKAKIAEQAIPYCNIVCIQGEEMKSALEGYLQVLCEMEKTSVGGALPSDDFYYIP